MLDELDKDDMLSDMIRNKKKINNLKPTIRAFGIDLLARFYHITLIGGQKLPRKNFLKQVFSPKNAIFA